MKPIHLILAVLLAALIAGLVGHSFGRSASADRVAELSRQIDRLRRERADLGGRLAGLERAARRDPVASGSAAVDPDGAGRAASGSAAPDAPEDPSAADERVLTPAERRTKVNALAAEISGWFDRGDGKGAIEGLKALARLLPEGRRSAMELAVAINEDLQGPNRLRLSEMVYYTSLGDPALVDLMRWSFENDSIDSFRSLASYSLPWVQSTEETVSRFTKALEAERAVEVQRALVWNLARVRKPEADAALAEILGDSGRDASLRSLIVTELALNTNEDIARAIETAAIADPDPVVRDAARAALVMRKPPVSGYLVTGTLPESQAAAAGMKTGDILVSYAGRAVRTLADLRSAAQEATSSESVTVIVVRDGVEVPVRLRPGQMGIYGKEVQAK